MLTIDPPTGFEHGEDLELHAEVHAAQVDAHHVVEVGDRDVGDRSRPVAAPCVVERRIQPAQAGDGPLDQVLDRRWITDVGGDDECSSARRVDVSRNLREGRLVAGGEHDGGAQIGEDLCGGCTDPTASSRDERDLSLEQARSNAGRWNVLSLGPHHDPPSIIAIPSEARRSARGTPAR